MDNENRKPKVNIQFVNFFDFRIAVCLTKSKGICFEDSLN